MLNSNKLIVKAPWPIIF